MRVMGIRYFDVVLILTGDRFTQGEHMLLREMREHRVPYFCVRTKVDLACHEEMAQEAENEEVEVSELPPARQEEIKINTITKIKTSFEEVGICDTYLIASQKKYVGDFSSTDLQHRLAAAIEGARCDRECPVCYETYGDFGGSAGMMNKLKCTHTVCASCRRHWQNALCVARVFLESCLHLVWHVYLS